LLLPSRISTVDLKEIDFEVATTKGNILLDRMCEILLFGAGNSCDNLESGIYRIAFILSSDPNRASSHSIVMSISDRHARHVLGFHGYNLAA
jgi:hypothetical protein